MLVIIVFIHTLFPDPVDPDPLFRLYVLVPDPPKDSGTTER